MRYLIYDTETYSTNETTDDINIHDHTPFMVSYVVADEKFNIVHQDYFNLEQLDKKAVFDSYLSKAPTIVGANIKFDIHMLLNAGYTDDQFNSKNYIDIQALARLVINSDLQTDASFRVGLKPLAVKYLGEDSNAEEKALKNELSQLKIKHKQKMKDYFISQGLWDTSLPRTTETKILNDIYDNWFKVYHTYPTFRAARSKFFKLYPRPSYKDCANVYTYAMTDAVLTYKLFKLWYPQIPRLEQTSTLIRISEAVYPLVLMERKGLSVDLPKLINDRYKLLKEVEKIKIISPITGEEVSADQNAKLKEIYEYETGLSLPNADEKTRKMISDKSPTAKLVSYKKKLLKYLNTYVTRILNKLTVVNNDYKVFTQYKLAGTVTGRLSSDFQQFPKEPLELETGDIISIRSWFKIPEGDKYMFFFDYSQLELRLQCEWTNLINGTPDMNMARAFMPYKCTEVNGKYYLDEDPNTEWTPTDLHAMTAKLAFPNIDENDPEWKHYRTLGKRCNFASNYGASANKLVDALDVDFPTAKRLVEGYKKTFKGVVDFGKWIQNRTYTIDKFPNLFNRKYYSTNKHQLQNWLVQGSGADLLLIKLRQSYEYLKSHPHWEFIITVHDEIGFTCKDIPVDQLNKEVKEIKDLLGHSLTAVDIVSDVEVTTTNWGEKDDWKEL
jgi:DNA polymerase-1